MRFTSLTLSVLACLFSIKGYTEDREETPLPIGNFSLPQSQQPASIYSFGSNILEPGQAQINFTPNVFKSTGERYIGGGSTLLYGTSKTTSLLFSVPATLSFTNGQVTHTGFGDLGLQGEYEFYHRASSKDKEHLAALAGFTVPSGDTHFTAGKFSYFFGGTYSHAWYNWLWFFAPGVLKFTGPPHKRLATRYYYEFGVGRNLGSQSGRYIFTGFLELNGQYDDQNPTDKPVTLESGGRVLSKGNLLFFTPSLWYSTPHWALKLGLSWPVTQDWLGTRNAVNYYAASSIIYTMN
ncbi:MAG: hypothetical protein Q8R79_08485 [Legionellaceae bacterium]|nr:hypothetical protein [Legionellaceae bacterium]